MGPSSQKGHKPGNVLRKGRGGLVKKKTALCDQAPIHCEFEKGLTLCLVRVIQSKENGSIAILLCKNSTDGHLKGCL